MAKTVIEVGVNKPNATTMLIEYAWLRLSAILCHQPASSGAVEGCELLHTNVENAKNASDTCKRLGNLTTSNDERDPGDDKEYAFKRFALKRPVMLTRHETGSR